MFIPKVQYIQTWQPPRPGTDPWLPLAGNPCLDLDRVDLDANDGAPALPPLLRGVTYLQAVRLTEFF